MPVARRLVMLSPVSKNGRTSFAMVSFILFLFASVLSSSLLVTAFAAADTEPKPLPARLFNPPTEYRGQFGNFRSPLLFENGEKVNTPQDWQRQRNEIL